MECEYKTTYSSTMYEIIVNNGNNIYLAIKDSIDSKVNNICKQSKSYKLKQTFSNPHKIIMIIINRFDNNNRKVNNVMCITESINIYSY